MTSGIGSGQVDFQLTYLDEKIKISEKYQNCWNFSAHIINFECGKCKSGKLILIQAKLNLSLLVQTDK